MGGLVLDLVVVSYSPLFAKIVFKTNDYAGWHWFTKGKLLEARPWARGWRPKITRKNCHRPERLTGGPIIFARLPGGGAARGFGNAWAGGFCRGAIHVCHQQ